MNQSMKEPINIYIDMDGVQTIFTDDSFDVVSKKGYFASRPCRKEAVELVKKLSESSYFNVYILSAVLQDDHSEKEKISWLENQGLGNIPRIFIPYGEKKGDYVKKEGRHILIDDYSKNLLEWETMGENFVGIKFLNGINGNHGSWKRFGGYCISHTQSADLLFTDVARIAQA